MFFILNRKALVALLINMARAAGLVVPMVTLRVSATNPCHEAAHFTVNQRSQDQVIMIVHQLVGVELDLVNLQPSVQNLLKGCEISLLLKYVRSQISAIQSVVSSPAFVGSWRPQHAASSSKRAAECTSK